MVRSLLVFNKHDRRRVGRAVGARTNLRDRTGSKTITAAAGDVDLGITKLPQGSLPSLLERRRRVNPGAVRGVMEAYVTSTRLLACLDDDDAGRREDCADDGA
jgi:transposase-like protein